MEGETIPANDILIALDEAMRSGNLFVAALVVSDPEKESRACYCISGGKGSAVDVILMLNSWQNVAVEISSEVISQSAETPAQAFAIAAALRKISDLNKDSD